MNLWQPSRYSITLGPRLLGPAHRSRLPCRLFTSTAGRRDADPRVKDVGRKITDDYASIRDTYQKPKHPIVLAHGLLGFAELPVPFLPTVYYWHGITPALTAQGVRVITPSVPPSASIEERAAKLSADISAQLESEPNKGRDGDGEGEERAVNIIAHSMGGLDARYMIAHCPPQNVRVKSLVTIATPHRGSSFADYVLAPGAGPLYLPRLYTLLQTAGLSTSAFAQLTTEHITGKFNPATPDSPDVRYFSFGAAVTDPPPLSPFRRSWAVIRETEGDNDGLVSVESSRWGEYQGTLMEVSHLDLINWSNRVKWTVREWMGMKKPFNAVAFYLDIADMLAKQGL